MLWGANNRCSLRSCVLRDMARVVLQVAWFDSELCGMRHVG
jgi:hypothetical protein